MLVELLRAYVRLCALVERTCAGTITVEQTVQELQALTQQPNESSAAWHARLDRMFGGAGR